MLLNFLEIVPPIPGTPKPALRKALQDFHNTAERIHRLEKHNYLNPIQNHQQPNQTSVEATRAAVQQYIVGNYCRQFGPVQTLLRRLSDYVGRASRANYPLHHQSVIKAFADMLLVLVTEGFMESSTTGTLTGDRPQSTFGDHWDFKKFNR